MINPVFYQGLATGLIVGFLTGFCAALLAVLRPGSPSRALHSGPPPVPAKKKGRF